jgi:hypothetical protein
VAEYLVNFSAKRIHFNPPWEECNTDDAGDDKQVRSEEQIKEPAYADFTFCKICKSKPR